MTYGIWMVESQAIAFNLNESVLWVLVRLSHSA